MFKEILASLRAIIVLTLITSVAYPLAITAIGQLAFPAQANGSLVKSGDTIVGSTLLAQKFTAPGYFAPRPSAADYATVASGASNQGYTSKRNLDAITERRATLGANAPSDLLTASGSGLDPDISPEAARFQAARVAGARGLPMEIVQKLVADHTQPPQLGFLGQARVNVLALNLALDSASAGNPDRVR
ncbi:MAG TPA: potassium-transporting ATPase subunit KdpC [Chthoniobacterales bacterium]|jgi:K+-transporting ATPase ATPase C chain